MSLYGYCDGDGVGKCKQTLTLRVSTFEKTVILAMSMVGAMNLAVQMLNA